jgi:molecular chaperone HtpG
MDGTMTITDNSTVIGKDVIESLTTGMYEDSRFIFREYIQNSADQIDKAHESGLLAEGEGDIFIKIDPRAQRIEFDDNATGIEQDKVLPILRNIAMSTKEKGKDKGFRGIGRLGGLGYCDKLIFITSAKGEAVKSTMVWDASYLKRIIGDRSKKESASDVINMVTSFSTDKEDVNEHYFKVILEGVNNKDLLDGEHIKSYLRMVAPVSYSTGFIYKSLIKKKVEELNVRLDEYKIYLNGEPLHKSYTADIYSDKNGRKEKIDEVIDVQFFQDTAKDGQLLYWGWYSVSTFKENIKKCNEARGIRVRKANIQIGDDYTLKDLHKEGRGNHYFFGEVHAVHPDLLPNSRRDNFSENDVFWEYKESLQSIFHRDLHKLYYDASKIRSAQKDIDAFDLYQEKLKTKEATGFTNKEDSEKSYLELEDRRRKAEAAQSTIKSFSEKNAEDSPVGKILCRVTPKDTEKVNINQPQIVAVPPTLEDGKINFRTDKYTWLDRNQRKLLSKVFGVIENVLAEEMASNLIAKIDESLKKK